MDTRLQPQMSEGGEKVETAQRNSWLARSQDNHLASLDTFRRRLNRALGDLGRVDVNLKTALDKLSTDLLRNPGEALPAGLGVQMEADLIAAIRCLADALVRAREFTDEVAASVSSPPQ